uniref:RRM domain-containing protein n=1 Tax=Heterorhabditis bacteriophora TaxID=37862 RepID=A0A1I7WH24_HETBA
MFAHYYPPVNLKIGIDFSEIAEYIQSGMLVSVMGGNGLHGSRYPPYHVPMTHIPLMHMAGRHASTACPGEGPPQMRKLFIGGLSHETSDDAVGFYSLDIRSSIYFSLRGTFQLRVYFSQWGPVVDAIVIRDPTTKQSRGFGFVTFATIASAETAMINRPHIIAGKTVCSHKEVY